MQNDDMSGKYYRTIATILNIPVSTKGSRIWMWNGKFMEPQLIVLRQVRYTRFHNALSE